MTWPSKELVQRVARCLSVAVGKVASMTATWSTSVRAVALPAANLSVFGALWVIEFLVLDRVLFAAPPRAKEHVR